MKKRTLGITPINKHLLALAVHLVLDWVNCIIFFQYHAWRGSQLHNDILATVSKPCMWLHSTIEWDEGSSCTANDRRFKIVSKPMVCSLAVAQKARQTPLSRAEVWGETAVVPCVVWNMLKNVHATTPAESTAFWVSANMEGCHRAESSAGPRLFERRR